MSYGKDTFEEMYILRELTIPLYTYVYHIHFLLQELHR
jgi:hypothetical protein